MKKPILVIIIAFLFISSSNAQTPGNTLNFDGTDYVSTALPSLFTSPATNDFTVECWVKPTAPSTQRVFFAQYDASNFASILLNTSNEVYAYVYYGGTYQDVKTTTVLSTTQWSHIAVCWDASDTLIQIYINGNLETLVVGGTSTNGNNNIMTIGSRSDGTQNIISEIDEFRVWDYVRTECDIQAGMNSDYTQAQSGLVAYYNFNQGTAGGNNSGVTSLTDFTGSYNGTLNSFTLSGSTSNWVNSSVSITQSNRTGTYYLASSDSICMGDTIYIGTQAYYTTGIHIDTFQTVLGCDSIISIDLHVDTVDASITQLTSIAYQSNATNSSYQWLDCDNSFAILGGEINQIFTATTNGNYALEVSTNTCVDTSACININGVGIIENSFEQSISVYPNPTSNNISIAFDNKCDKISLRILNIEGKVITVENYKNTTLINTEINSSAGFYFVEIISDKGEKAIYKILKKD